MMRVLTSLVLSSTLVGGLMAQDVPVTEVPLWGKAAIEKYIDGARTRTLAACTAKGIKLPGDFLAWIDGDPILRASVYGCRKDPLLVLLGLRALEIDLGEEAVRRDYTQLALAFAMHGSYSAPRAKASGWNDGDGAPTGDLLPDVAPRSPLELVIMGDPRQRVLTKDVDRKLDRDDHIINFLEGHKGIEVDVTTKELPPLEYDAKGVAKPRGKPVKVIRKQLRPLVGADVIASAVLQAEFNEYMKAEGHADVSLDCGDQIVHWKSKAAVRDSATRKRIAAAHNLFHDAYRAKGRMPAERDRAPTPSESMAWFIRNDRHAFTPEEQKTRKWPRFPLNAPWPVLLMLAADDQPLREREDIWTKFRDAGEFRTYGEYIGGIAQQFDMQSARRVSPYAFNYGSIQMMWKDGGVCGTMGNIGARTYRICGVPSSTAGQPGHCAIVLMAFNQKTGKYRCRGGQYATGGDEVTSVHARWNYDDVGGRRPMVFHQSVAWGVNHGFASFVDALVLQRVWKATDETARKARGAGFMRAVMATNPFALGSVHAAISDASSSAGVVAALGAFLDRVEALAKPAAYRLYRDTVQKMAHARALALPGSKTKDEAVRLLAALEQQDCQSPKLLARCWRRIGGEEGFTQYCVAAVKNYVATPVPSRNKQAASRFASWIKVWARSVKGGAAKQAWANELLAGFAGKEALQIKGKVSLDPAVAALCKTAGREPPKVGRSGG